jgi:2-dehydro-3-deoxyphosphogluconate aldolase/(4S)-4-hydroxy-2-oxoglutarate aldolase
MDKRIQITELLGTQGVLPLYYHPDTTVTAETARALYQAGIRALEYTNRGEHALRNFERLRKLCDQELGGMFLGVGTIKEAGIAKTYVQAGADFLVSPGLAEDVYDITYSSKTLWIPGCMTVTEILRAEQFGLRLVKLFPGSVLGPSFIESISEIFPAISFMPTGAVGLDRANLEAWFRAGAYAVGIGSRLLPKAALDAGDFEKIRSSAKDLLVLVEAIRKK